MSNPIKNHRRIPVRLGLALLVATLVVALAGLGSAAYAVGPTVVRYQGVDRFATSANLAASVPVGVVGVGSGVAAVSAGDDFFCALTSAGAISAGAQAGTAYWATAPQPLPRSQLMSSG